MRILLGTGHGFVDNRLRVWFVDISFIRAKQNANPSVDTLEGNIANGASEDDERRSGSRETQRDLLAAPGDFAAPPGAHAVTRIRGRLHSGDRRSHGSVRRPGPGVAPQSPRHPNG